MISLVAQATDNAIKMAYNFTTVAQTVVFNSAMQAGGTLTLSAQAMDGGGRSPGDPLTLKLVFYNSSNAVITTVQQAFTLTYGATTPSTYSVSTANCGGSCTNVAYVSVQFYGKDGGYWAGNYGPYIISPSLTFAGGSNILYNPQFGIYNTTTYAQGWTSSAGWQNCALYSGSATCVIDNGAQVNGGTYSATGGTTSGTAGGYAAAPTYSSGITSAQQTSKNTNTTARQAQTSNQIYVDQAGDNNTITLRQASGTTSKSRMTVYSHGDGNTLNLNQGYNSNGTLDGVDSNNHYLNFYLSGNSNTATIVQKDSGSGAGQYMETTVTGNSNVIDLKQSNASGKTMFTNINGSNNSVTVTQKDGGVDYLDIKLTGNGHTVNALQEGGGNHAATIDLTNGGGASSVTLTQSGSTAQVYSIQQTCTNPAGCSVTITQP